MWWAYLLSAFAGGVIAIVAAIVALTVASKTGNMMSIHFGDSGFKTYKYLELLDYGVRSGGIYVKYQNVGDQTASTACFRIKIYDNKGLLFAEAEESVYDEILPNEAQEHIITPQELANSIVQDPDNKVEVLLRFGYLD